MIYLGNSVLILGNGFDVAVGRRTKYENFYNSKYCPKDYPAPLIKFLNGRWNEKDLGGVRWLDMENALHEYAQNPPEDDYYSRIEEEALSIYYNNSEEVSFRPYNNPNIRKMDGLISSPNQYYQIIKDLKDSNRLPDKVENFEKLREIYNAYYELERISRDKKAFLKIEEGLASYLSEEGEQNYFDIDEKAISLLSEYLNYNSENSYAGISSIYSFNYTSIDNLLEGEEKQKSIKKLHYMHGSLRDNHVIIGTKDGAYDKYDFLQKAFDPKYNPPSLLDDMQRANRIDIYGHSLGNCDSQYFRPFFESVITGDSPKKTINIYTYNDDSEIQIKKNLNILTDNKLSYLYSKSNLHFIKSKE